MGAANSSESMVPVAPNYTLLY